MLLLNLSQALSSWTHSTIFHRNRKETNRMHMYECSCVFECVCGACFGNFHSSWLNCWFLLLPYTVQWCAACMTMSLLNAHISQSQIAFVHLKIEHRLNNEEICSKIEPMSKNTMNGASCANRAIVKFRDISNEKEQSITQANRHKH